MNCRYFGVCGGCPTGGTPYTTQISNKIAPIISALGIEPKVLSLGEERLRDRVELVWERLSDGRSILGLFKHEAREIWDLDACPMLSEPLENWLKDFRLKAPPIQRGTVRLRVSPSGQRGAWLDFANEDVRDLFAERTYLEWLSERAIVEIGQRRKRLVWKGGSPKLVDPELATWFETYGRDGRAIPLWGVIGGFSQVGFRSNRALVDKVVEFARSSKVREWVELFCGNGNFSLALADQGLVVHAYENDELGVAGLERARGELQANLQVSRVDVYHHSHKIGSLAGKGLLVDPPRSGLGKLLVWLEAMPLADRPQNIIYVSCFTDSFTSDILKLRELGYSVAQLEGVDQFPHSSHMEWVSALVKTS